MTQEKNLLMRTLKKRLSLTVIVRYTGLGAEKTLNYFKMAQNTKKKSTEKIFCNESLRNLKNVLQGNLRTDRAKEYTNLELFRGSGGTNFENFSAWLHPTFAGSMCVPACPKKLWIRH